MKLEQFNHSVNEQIARSTSVLIDKAAEYATEDRMHNFRVAGQLQGCSIQKAIAGMMAKHTISVYDMCNSGESYSMDMWNEKITDHINYLLLLRASLDDSQEKHTL